MLYGSDEEKVKLELVREWFNLNRQLNYPAGFASWLMSFRRGNEMVGATVCRIYREIESGNLLGGR